MITSPNPGIMTNDKTGIPKIDIRALADALSKIGIVTGLHVPPYSLAQRAVWLSRRVQPSAMADALFWEAHRAVPAKQSAIRIALRLTAEPAANTLIAIKHAILVAQATETRDLGVAYDTPANIKPDPEPIKPLPWAKAQDLFMTRYEELFGRLI
jgi:hypothetical protein